jgi:hypothetical protein
MIWSLLVCSRSRYLPYWADKSPTKFPSIDRDLLNPALINPCVDLTFGNIELDRNFMLNLVVLTVFLSD